MFNPRALKLFHLIADKGSLAAAAEHFHLSPPAASRLIGLLEDDLGFDLFSREGRNLALSEKGLRFLQESRPILTSFESMDRLAQDIRSNVEVHLRVLSTAPSATAWISPALALLKRRHPGLTCNIEIVDWLGLQSSLGSTTHDIAIASLPISSSVFSLNADVLCHFRNELVMHRDNPLAGKSEITVADLQEQDIIVLHKGQLARDRMDELFRANGLKLVPHIETSSSLVSMTLCRENIGVTIVPSMYMHGLQSDVLVSRPIVPERWITFGALTPKSRTLSDIQKEFIANLVAVASKWDGTRMDP